MSFKRENTYNKAFSLLPFKDYILFFFKDILSKDKFSIFNKEKNIELIKFKNIVENYNKSKPINE